jgi:hypothetical protein
MRVVVIAGSPVTGYVLQGLDEYEIDIHVDTSKH